MYMLPQICVPQLPLTYSVWQHTQCCMNAHSTVILPVFLYSASPTRAEVQPAEHDQLCPTACCALQTHAAATCGILRCSAHCMCYARNTEGAAPAVDALHVARHTAA